MPMERWMRGNRRYTGCMVCRWSAGCAGIGDIQDVWYADGGMPMERWMRGNRRYTGCMVCRWSAGCAGIGDIQDVWRRYTRTDNRYLPFFFVFFPLSSSFFSVLTSGRIGGASVKRNCHCQLEDSSLSNLIYTAFLLRSKSLTT